MRYELDQGAGGAGRAGLIVLSTDETLEFEARQVLAGRPVNLLHSRIPAQHHVTPELLRRMETELAATAERLPEGLDVIAYACTSAATLIGPSRVARHLHEAHPGVPATDPMSAVIAALRVLGVECIGLVTPYVDSVTAPMRAHLEANGITVARDVSFGEKNDRTVARIAESSTREAMLEAAGAPGVKAVFASCTNLRSFGVIEEVEAALNLPVISSNLALIWHMLGLMGCDTRGWRPGRLFSHPAAALQDA